MCVFLGQTTTLIWSRRVKGFILNMIEFLKDFFKKKKKKDFFCLKKQEYSAVLSHIAILATNYPLKLHRGEKSHLLSMLSSNINRPNRIHKRRLESLCGNHVVKGKYHKLEINLVPVRIIPPSISLPLEKKVSSYLFDPKSQIQL